MLETFFENCAENSRYSSGKISAILSKMQTNCAKELPGREFETFFPTFREKFPEFERNNFEWVFKIAF